MLKTDSKKELQHVISRIQFMLFLLKRMDLVCVIVLLGEAAAKLADRFCKYFMIHHNVL